MYERKYLWRGRAQQVVEDSMIYNRVERLDDLDDFYQKSILKFHRWNSIRVFIVIGEKVNHAPGPYLENSNPRPTQLVL